MCQHLYASAAARYNGELLNVICTCPLTLMRTRDPAGPFLTALCSQ